DLEDEVACGQLGQLRAQARGHEPPQALDVAAGLQHVRLRERRILVEVDVLPAKELADGVEEGDLAAAEEVDVGVDVGVEEADRLPVRRRVLPAAGRVFVVGDADVEAVLAPGRAVPRPPRSTLLEELEVAALGEQGRGVGIELPAA
ncbi:MAG: hypothetical protein ACK559_08380, partial [bacterium]